MSAPIARTVQMRLCAAADCDARFEHPHGGSWRTAFCSQACSDRDTRSRRAPARPRAKIVTRPTAKQRRAISPASPEQREKKRTQPSIVSGATTSLDPAHLALRGCDDPLCTVSLTRAEHRAFDDGELDLLPYLVKAGCVEEIAHAVHHYEGRLPALLARLTGTRWAPAGRTEAC